MKTSDVMNIGYGRFYGMGLLESLHDKKIDDISTINTVEMTKDRDKYVIIDNIKADRATGGYSALELVADNDNYIISIKSLLKINPPIDELSFYKLLNVLNLEKSSCSTSYDESVYIIKTEAYISFCGYPICWDEGTDDEPLFTSSPEIEGFINLLSQVTGRIFKVSKEIASYK